MEADAKKQKQLLERFKTKALRVQHERENGILGSKYDMSLRIDGITYGIDVISRRLCCVNSWLDGILGSKYDMSLRIDGITCWLDVISRRLDGVN